MKTRPKQSRLKRPENVMDRVVYGLGGQTEAAKALGVSSQTLNFWRQRGSMPTDTPDARERVLLAERLSGIHRLELVGLGTVLKEKGPSGSFRCTPAERRRLLKLAAGRRRATDHTVNALAMAS